MLSFFLRSFEMLSLRRDTDRTCTRMFSRSSRPTPRTKHRRFLRFEPLEERVVLSTYWVSPSGNDSNPGTNAQPWKTLQACMDKLLPGDTLDIMAGTYVGWVSGWDSGPANVSGISGDGNGGDPYGYIHGTAGNPITIQAAPNAAPGSVILNTRNPETAEAIDLEPSCAPGYIIIKGLTFTDPGWNGTTGITDIPNNNGYAIRVDCGNTQILNCVVQNLQWGVAGISCQNGTGDLVQGCTISNINGNGNSSNGHGIYFGDGLSNSQIIGNTISNCDSTAIQCNGDIAVSNNLAVSNNTCYDNGGQLFYINGVTNSLFSNNLVYGTGGGPNNAAATCGIEFDWDTVDDPTLPACTGNVVVNNTIVDIPSAPVRIKSGCVDNTVLNNILLANDGTSLRISSGALTGLVSDYNIGGQATSFYTDEDSGNTSSLTAWLHPVRTRIRSVQERAHQPPKPCSLLIHRPTITRNYPPARRSTRVHQRMRRVRASLVTPALAATVTTSAATNTRQQHLHPHQQLQLRPHQHLRSHQQLRPRLRPHQQLRPRLRPHQQLHQHLRPRPRPHQHLPQSPSSPTDQLPMARRTNQARPSPRSHLHLRPHPHLRPHLHPQLHPQLHLHLHPRPHPHLRLPQSPSSPTDQLPMARRTNQARPSLSPAVRRPVILRSSRLLWGANSPTTHSSPPAGWSTVAQNVIESSSNGNEGASVYYRVIQAGDTSWTFTMSESAYISFALQSFSGINTSSPIDNTGTTSANSGSNTITTNSVTVNSSGAWELISVSQSNGGTIPTATNFTALSNEDRNSTLLYDTTALNPGATGAVTVTGGGPAAGNMLVAIPFTIVPASTTPPTVTSETPASGTTGVAMSFTTGNTASTPITVVPTSTPITVVPTSTPITVVPNGSVTYGTTDESSQTVTLPSGTTAGDLAVVTIAW